ncbi:MAG: hypothetical protein QXN34_00290 [Archaeoglobaceae archaeon]
MDVSKGRILCYKKGASFFNEIEAPTRASPINKTLAELEREKLVFFELDQSTRRKRSSYKLNEEKKDEIEELREIMKEVLG